MKSEVFSPKDTREQINQDLEYAKWMKRVGVFGMIVGTGFIFLAATGEFQWEATLTALGVMTIAGMIYKLGSRDIKRMAWLVRDKNCDDRSVKIKKP
jgi:hypothetical protein